MAHSDGEAQVLAAIKRGIRGYVLQSCESEVLPVAIRAVHCGRRYFCSSVAHWLSGARIGSLLTARESDVLNQLALGFSNKMIAGALGIECGTVKTHLKTVMSKLQVNTRTEAVVVATRRGLLSDRRV